MAFDITARIEAWQKNLLDTSKRNRLIKFTTNRAGGIAFLHPDANIVWQRLIVEGKPYSFPWKRDLVDDLLEEEEEENAEKLREYTEKCRASPFLEADDLLTEFTDKKLLANLLRLSRNASESETEHGVSTLFAPFGFLRWFESHDSTEEIRSPLVLVPVRLSRASVESPWTLKRDDDDPAVNHCLAELMATDFGIKLPRDDDAFIDTDAPDGWSKYLEKVTESIRSMPRWEVVREAALGVFNFQKLAMWEDLKRNTERIGQHKLCRAIAGDKSVELTPPADLITADELDEAVPPERAIHILDADSSQHEAIEAIKSGADVVIDGPPGTGKSQTIANAIAELLAAGKTVLFVSEKTAALEVVKNRLDDCGLGDFCLELHSHKANKREVAVELGRCLELPRESATDITKDLKQLADDRLQLNRYVAELHRSRSPLNLSMFQVHGELAKLANVSDSSRWVAPNIMLHDADYPRQVSEILQRLTNCHDVVDPSSVHPWRNCKLTNVNQSTLDDVRYHLRHITSGTARLCEGATLAELALSNAANTIPLWRDSVVFAKTVLTMPMIPTTWFKANALEAANAATAIHTATTRVRSLLPQLAMFDADKVAALPSGTKLSAGLATKELLVNASLPPRERIGELRTLAVKLRAILPIVRTLNDQLNSVQKLLQMTSVVHLSDADEFAKIMTDIGKGEPIPSSWWDSARRSELKTVVSRATEEDKSAQTIRSRLVTKIGPIAFAPESAATVREASKYGNSFWRRWLPRWKQLREQAQSWYITTDHTQLRSELLELVAFHRHAEYTRQVHNGYPGDILVVESRPNWPATLDGLNAVDRFEELKFPTKLRSALAPKGKFDRRAAEKLGESLAQSESTFQMSWRELQSIYQSTISPDVPATELLAILDADMNSADAEANAIERLVSLLRDGQELASGTWKTFAVDLDELVRLRSQIASDAKLLSISDPVKIIESTDWSPQAKAGEQLVSLLKNIPSPSAKLVAALTDSVVRERLKLAIDVSDSVVRDGFEESWNYLSATLFDVDAIVSDARKLSQTPIAELSKWSSARVADVERLEEWVRFVQVRREAATLGIESVVDEVCAGRIPIDRASDAFRRRFLTLWLDAICEQVPILKKFDADAHETRIARFIKLDRLSVESSRLRLRAQLLSLPYRPNADGSAPPSSELGILLREANKKLKHLPVRALFREVPMLLPRVKPCLMMSPLAVSTYLNASDMVFDVVIFDEASQVRPHDAICAIYRAKQLVVGGDPKQLPPTDFFARSMNDENEDESEDGTAGFESLLDVCLSLGLVRKRLKWHYRSRREGLIAFSNQYFYDHSLITFPSVDDGAERAVKFERVVDGRFTDRVNIVEARHTATKVIEHFRSSPKRSLGVIAFSQSQQNRILDEIESLRGQNPDLEEFFNEDRHERFFVKNLENVQGDERDVIMLSVGYGPDAAGKIAMRFGPLNRQGGERRLNVAVTRARYGMVVIASMTATDIDLSRTSADGPRLLRAFLDYAERGPIALTETITSANNEQFGSPFEQAVCEELQRRGLTIHRQIGCSGYRIDLAVVESATSSRYLLGIECDGATYHSSATARDRDRLRQSVLEGLGWRLCRVWSTDWVRNREKQVQRVLAALESAKKPRKSPEKSAPLKNSFPRAKASTTYDSIEDVPDDVLQTTIQSTIVLCGASDVEELLVSVREKLGFKRLGPMIRLRIEEALNALIESQKLERRVDGRIATVKSG